MFATGVTDSLSPIDGVAARWGKSIFHCPYCHGFELEQGAIGVIATGPMSLHQALMLPDWGRVTLLTNDAIELDGAQREELAGRGVAIEEKRIARISGHAEVQFESGDAAAFAGLFLASRTLPASSLPERLGCTIEETPMGLQIRTDAAKETSVPGVFGCGDVARAPHSVSLAVADGAWAGAQTHRSLLFG
ncbi:MAG: NAD(P)/FAD-dependent oxidoreductase [Hyphomonadaceae bacterium JAD_PAG50586_4]|nr:MAG: NAD(P)/FAD-dependent oxidoreductase [Hyphomonadaceae bacterium JAD_PAG50586_4]